MSPAGFKQLLACRPKSRPDHDFESHSAANLETASMNMIKYTHANTHAHASDSGLG